MSPNPIEHRLEKLRSQWAAFSEQKDARVLVWSFDAGELGMLDGFLALENHEEGAFPDLFVRLKDPFADGEAYCEALVGRIVSDLEELRDELVEQGFPKAWIPPTKAPGAAGQDHLAATLASLQAHYAEWMEHAVLVLTPEQADIGVFQRWLFALTPKLPDTVRIVVVDAADAPQFAPLVAADPKRITAVRADLDMAGAVREIADAANQGEAGGEFRVHFVALMQAIGAGNVSEAEAAAGAARQIAVAENWPKLAVPVELALGTAYLQVRRPQDALRAYQAADAAGQAVEASGDAVGTTLRLQAQLAIGGALVSVGDFAGAATTYEGAAALAQASKVPLLELESWRMVAYCREVRQEPDQSWSAGEKGLALADAMDAETRAQSTLPYLGEGLLRITALPAYRSLQGAVNERMGALLGKKDWRPKDVAPTGGGKR